MKKKFTKFFAVLLVIAMLASQMVAPAFAVNTTTYYCSSCGTDGQLGTLKRTIDPTCGKDGYKIYACVNPDCDPAAGVEATITLVVPATSVHTGDGNVVPAVPSSCTAAGTYAYETCTGCGKKLEPGTANEIDIVDPIDAHVYNSVVTAPDCENGGYTTYTCVCGDTYVGDEVPCLEHAFTVYHAEKPATCKEEGHSAYYSCANAGCNEIDEENPKTVLPIENHNLHIDVTGSQAPDCTTDGWNLFVCENDDCPYWEGNGGVKEPLDKLGHDLTETNAKAATCTDDGNIAYWTCATCEKHFTTDAATTEVDLADTVLPATGHTEIAVDYKAPTCTEDGAKDGIICDVCKAVLHASVKIPATGHDLSYTVAAASTCDTHGHTAYAQCDVCDKYFDAETSATDNVDAVALNYNTDIKLPLREHVTVERVALAATCTTTGVLVTTCTYDDCRYAVSDTIDALGHDLTLVAATAPTCLVDGELAHTECSVCHKNFAADADETDITIEEIADADLIDEAPGHTEVEVAFKAPTYNEAGTYAGTKCSVCNAPLVDAAEIPELQEAIEFSYELTGVNGADIAVNSGTVTLKIYFKVLADANDDEDWNSDVLANIFGIDFVVSYNNNAFALTNVDDVNVPFVGSFASTPTATANNNGVVAIAQNASTPAGVAFKDDQGKILLTTLTFDVLDETAAADYTFDFDWTVTHPEDDHANGVYNVDTSTSANSAAIEVRMLGDANYSGFFSSADTLKISQYIKAAAESETPVAYVAEYDMNKDGFIDGLDLSLLRRAIVGDNAYLA